MNLIPAYFFKFSQQYDTRFLIISATVTLHHVVHFSDTTTMYRLHVPSAGSDSTGDGAESLA